MNLPKISCLTVTLDRLDLLKRSIKCFCDQTYPNKELVVVTDGDDKYKREIRKFVQPLNSPDITLRFLEKENFTLGALRNISIESAHGEVLCQWDDDDINHPQRLQAQFDFMISQNAKACFLTDQLHYFENDGQMFWVDWSHGDDINIIPGTLMMQSDLRFRYPEKGEFAKMGEDTILLVQLLNKVKVAKMSGRGYLNVYVFHGKNTYSLGHHEKILSTFKLRGADSASVKELMQALTYYKLPNVDYVNVFDRKVTLGKEII